MEKRQLIDAIRQINSTATVEFLSDFEETDLKQYLEHLNNACSRQPRQTSRKSNERMVA